MLGLIYALIAFGFALLWVVSNMRESYIYGLLGKYGFLIMALLAVTQGSLDGSYATVPASVGYFIMFSISLFMLFVVIDVGYFLYMIIPRRKKKGQSWKMILFGGGAE